MSVAVLAGLFVFAAGLGSFLSPCVLPLVPGYLSMLSGVGVDKLREGEGETSKLFSSALAFVIGLSVVFITMGATASAVGQFLLKHRDLLAPIAGAVIILFGLHLIGWLIKLPLRVGLIVGVILVAIGIVLNLRTAESVVKPIYFYAASLIFLFGPPLTRWLNRDVHLLDVGGKNPGIVSGFLLGFAFALGWTPCIGPILTTVLAIAASRGNVRDGVILLTSLSFRGSFDSVSADGGRRRPFHEVLSEISQAPAHRRGLQRSAASDHRRFDFHECADAHLPQHQRNQFRGRARRKMDALEAVRQWLKKTRQLLRKAERSSVNLSPCT